MSDGTSRAGWHAQHLRHGAAQPGKQPSANTRGERGRLLREAMRAFDEEWVARQAARNPSIVPADSLLNRAFVNDGENGFRELTQAEGVDAVLDYGDGRIDAVKRKWHERAFETTTIVTWVPKALLTEIPDYYPVYNKRGDEIGRRSRWVMPDDPAGQAEVQRWLDETIAHLTEDVLTGGPDSIHGYVWNFDESAPHVHFMADTCAPLHKNLRVDLSGAMLDADGHVIVKHGKPLLLEKVVASVTDLDGVARVAAAPNIRCDEIGAIDQHGYLVGQDGDRMRDEAGKIVPASTDLRVEAQQMWGQSSETTEARVVDGVEREVKITGATKMSRYQTRYRERLIEAGFEVEAEVNEKGTSLDKQAFGASEAERLELAQSQKRLDLDRAQVDAAFASIAEAEGEALATIAQARVATEDLDARKAGLDERERQLDAREAQAADQFQDAARLLRQAREAREEAEAENVAAAEKKRSAQAKLDEAAKKELDAQTKFDEAVEKESAARVQYEMAQAAIEEAAEDSRIFAEATAEYKEQARAAAAAAEAMQNPSLDDLNNHAYHYLRETKLTSGQTMLEAAMEGGKKRFQKTHAFGDFDKEGQQTRGEARRIAEARYGAAVSDRTSRSATTTVNRGDAQEWSERWN